MVPSRKIFENSRIIKVQKNNSGIYDAMNQALEYANGEYVLFLNAGDCFCNISVLSSFIKAINGHNKLALVYCDYKTTSFGEYVQSPAKLSDFFLSRTMLCHQVCMIRRDLYSTIGHFDTAFKIDADYDFLLRLLIVKRERFIHIQPLGIISRSHGFSFQNGELAKKRLYTLERSIFRRCISLM